MKRLAARLSHWRTWMPTPEEAEEEYIRLTDLAKLRIARTILLDVVSLPRRLAIASEVYDYIRELEKKTGDF